MVDPTCDLICKTYIYDINKHFLARFVGKTKKSIKKIIGNIIYSYPIYIKIKLNSNKHINTSRLNIITMANRTSIAPDSHTLEPANVISIPDPSPFDITDLSTAPMTVSEIDQRLDALNQIDSV